MFLVLIANLFIKEEFPQRENGKSILRLPAETEFKSPTSL